ncbi:MAG: NAD-dependent epimerase/dehydratase family protein, partial [Actinomycetota bacterium]|nr:NAD-dependent epimerase/dehydratase family protein [Actinomycetota bacterium]
MRIVVVGASGNVGTSVLDALAGDPAVEEIVGVARRRPSLTLPKTTWVQADVVDSDLTAILRGADCVIHLAWLIQPSRDLQT